MKIEYLNEIWKDIKGYEGLYQVSNFGRVRSLDRWVNNAWGNGLRIVKGQILTINILPSGYCRVMLSKNSKPKSHYVHRLVAIAFIPNPHNYPEVNHKNEIKTDNRVDNLEWCTAKYNANYGTRTERQSAKKTNGKLSKPVNFTIDGVIIMKFPSASEAGRYFGVNKCVVVNVCANRRKLHNGFSFNYS